MVESDKLKIGQRKFNRGHRVEWQWIFGDIERESGSSILIPVERRNKDTLLSIIKEWICHAPLLLATVWRYTIKLKKYIFNWLTLSQYIY